GHGAPRSTLVAAWRRLFLPGSSLSGVHAGNVGHAAELEVAGGATVVVFPDHHLGWGHRGVLLRPGLWKTSHGAAHQSGEKLGRRGRVVGCQRRRRWVGVSLCGCDPWIPG